MHCAPLSVSELPARLPMSLYLEKLVTLAIVMRPMRAFAIGSSVALFHASARSAESVILSLRTASAPPTKHLQAGL
jgi:hypothetical protein